VLVRPGDLRLTAAADGALTATVLTHSFLGPVTRLTVRLDDGSSTLVRVDVASAEASAWPPAAAVGLTVAPAAAMLAN
jgi:putative spermidine/putrescine transport system ATP-binding protein